MGDLSLLGANSGSLSEVILIPAKIIAVGEEANITDFGATGGVGSVDTLVRFQLSDDNFSGSIVEFSRIEIPSNGTVLKTLDTPIKVKAGESFRVVGIQGTIGDFSAELSGQTSKARAQTEADIRNTL